MSSTVPTQTGCRRHRAGRGGNAFVVILIGVAMVLNASGSAGAQSADTAAAVSKEAGPADLFGEVEQVRSMVEAIRSHMGAAKAGPLNISIHNVSSQDLYCQALTLFAKADRLSFEVTRANTPPPPLAPGAPRMEDVQRLMRAAHACLSRIMQELHTGSESSAVRIPEAKSQDELFTAIQAANRQLSLLLERRFTETDIYAEVTLAVGYTARLLAVYPQAKLIPAEPAREADRQIADVYMRLLQCLDLIAGIYHALDQQMLSIDASDIRDNTLTASDSYDLAASIVARLDFLHRFLGLSQDPPPAFYPGRRYPADLYQRAGLLLVQLQELSALVQSKGPPSRNTIRQGQ